jgi:hypothetical protein
LFMLSFSQVRRTATIHKAIPEKRKTHSILRVLAILPKTNKVITIGNNSAIIHISGPFDRYRPMIRRVVVKADLVAPSLFSSSRSVKQYLSLFRVPFTWIGKDGKRPFTVLSGETASSRLSTGFVLSSDSRTSMLQDRTRLKRANNVYPTC